MFVRFVRMLYIHSTQAKFTIGLKNSCISFLKQVYSNSYRNMSVNKSAITELSSWFQIINGLTCHFAEWFLFTCTSVDSAIMKIFTSLRHWNSWPKSAFTSNPFVYSKEVNKNNQCYLNIKLHRLLRCKQFSFYKDSSF